MKSLGNSVDGELSFLIGYGSAHGFLVEFVAL